MRVQLCGRVCIEIDGARRDSRLPGPQGRRLFCYLTIRRFAAVTRPDLCAALWGDQPPAAPDSARNALLSGLRTTIQPVAFDGLRLALPASAWVDIDAALRVYDSLVRLLCDELGVVPSQPIRELHARLLPSAG